MQGGKFSWDWHMDYSGKNKPDRCNEQKIKLHKSSSINYYLQIAANKTVINQLFIMTSRRIQK